MWNNPHMLVLDEPTNYLDRRAGWRFPVFLLFLAAPDADTQCSTYFALSASMDANYDPPATELCCAFALLAGEP
jgi:hypothetical protein